MYLFIYIYLYIYIYIHIYLYIFIYIYIYEYLYLYTYMYIQLLEHVVFEEHDEDESVAILRAVREPTNRQSLEPLSALQVVCVVRLYTCMSIYMYTCICTYKYVYVYMYIRIYVHTHHEPTVFGTLVSFAGRMHCVHIYINIYNYLCILDVHTRVASLWNPR